MADVIMERQVPQITQEGLQKLKPASWIEPESILETNAANVACKTATVYLDREVANSKWIGGLQPIKGT